VTPLADAGTSARVAFYGTLGIFVLLEQRTRFRSMRNRQGERSDRGSLFVVVACIGGAVAGAFAIASDAPGAAIGLRAPVLVAGIALIWAGILLRQWSIVVLGRFFTIDVRVEHGQPVVDRGPYRWVRHPSYTGMLLTLLGLGLALGNWLSLTLLAIVPAIGLIVRIRVEERALLAALGEPYRLFAERRRRLIPGLW
jgi:protein-S-isoprenylcysteine O-methyltransferase Ste14